jgi:hypothetical protein
MYRTRVRGTLVMLGFLKRHSKLRPNLQAVPLFCAIVLSGVSGQASTLKISAGSANRAADEIEADYSTSHLFVDEVASTTVPITVFFDPQITGIETAEVFTNLNRRNRATLDADGDGIEDGIKPPFGNSIPAGDDQNYYKAYTMALVNSGYQLTLSAAKCGAYRLSARYRLNGDVPGTYRWYGDERNTKGFLKRDHAIVVSPSKAKNLQIYEVNPLTINATGTSAAQRGTLADLAGGVPTGQGPKFSLQYIKSLGCNALWLQPIHPRGISGRESDPVTHQVYELGSSYAVKNFFAVMPIMAKGFTPGGTPADDDTAAGRAQAMSEYQQFVGAADSLHIDIVIDAPFNHAAHDVELADPGQKYWGNASSNPTTEIRNVEARVFSRTDAYDMRAFNASSIALAPDRYDFSPSPPSYGKWPDVSDLFFGLYASLVPNHAGLQNYLNEEDWFDYSVGTENGSGQGNGHFDRITQSVWRYFGDYLQFWLTQTGYPENSAGASLESDAGVDALRADFGQGLPPQCWEYLINRTRTRKWNFVFMAESLDGGPPAYRSARHFDILNEKLIYELHHARSTSEFRRLYEDRRASYGSALMLLNTSSQDEDTYRNPFQALLRFAVSSTLDGAPMIFPGQELGLIGTIVPPNDSDPALGQPFGYERYESGFFGKPIPHFKIYNSLMPLWRQLAQNDSNGQHLHDIYSSIGQARNFSPALRSTTRCFLNLQSSGPQDQIFSVAKFEKRNGDPGASDVVFAFVSLTTDSNVETPPGNWFNVNIDEDHDGTNDFGIKPDRLYNIKNIAAYTGTDSHRRDIWIWNNPRSGSDVLKNGIYVHLNRVPTNPADWANAPYEPQYLKLFDVTDSPVPHARVP